MLTKKYEGLTGEELPRKGEKKMEYISLKDYREKIVPILKHRHFSPDWGHAQNNPCESNETTDGRRVEEYSRNGWLPRFYIETLTH